MVLLYFPNFESPLAGRSRVYTGDGGIAILIVIAAAHVVAAGCSSYSEDAADYDNVDMHVTDDDADGDEADDDEDE